jgi:DNA invertase Pin-like site-specific DNA recombinase
MLVFHMLGAISEFERELIRERTRAGLVEAKRQGKQGGRPKAMSATETREASAMLSTGAFTAKGVAKKFGISKATLYRSIKGSQHIEIGSESI